MPAILTKDASPGVITTASGKKVPQLIFEPSLFCDKTTVLYGPSRTGKTVHVKSIMQTLNGFVDEIIVVAPSEPSNRSYAGFVEAPLIHYRPWIADPANPKKDDGAKGTQRFLDLIWKRQEMKAAVYTRANRLATLGSLFARIPKAQRAEGAVHLRSLNEKRVKVLSKLRSQYADDKGRMSEKRSSIQEKFKQMVILVYKKFIAPHYVLLAEMKDLSEDERYSLKYLQFNPRLLLIFDDCAAQLKPMFSKECFRLLFYQNRHSYISTVVCCQDDTDLPANLRKNAFVSIFTENVVTASAFERAANKYSKPLRQYVADIAPDVFTGHRKLAYIRDDARHINFYYTDVKPPDQFPFGSTALHALCDLVRSDQTTMDRDNPYHDLFKA